MRCEVCRSDVEPLFYVHASALALSALDMDPSGDGALHVCSACQEFLYQFERPPPGRPPKDSRGAA